MTSLSNLTNYTVHLIFTHSSGNYGLLLVSYTRRLITTLLDSHTQYQIALTVNLTTGSAHDRDQNYQAQ